MVKKLLTFLVVLGIISALGYALIGNNNLMSSQTALLYISEMETYGNELLPELQETINNFNPDNYNQELTKWTFDEPEDASGISLVLNKIANWIGTLVAYTVVTFKNIMNLSVSIIKSLWFTLKILGSLIKAIWYFLYGEIV